MSHFDSSRDLVHPAASRGPSKRANILLAAIVISAKAQECGLGQVSPLPPTSPPLPSLARCAQKFTKLHLTGLNFHMK